MNKEEAKNKWKGTGKTKYREYEKLHSYLRLIWLMIPEVEFWCLWFEEDRSQLKWERERIVVAIALIWRLRKESNLGTNSLYGMCVQEHRSPEKPQLSSTSWSLLHPNCSCCLQPCSVLTGREWVKNEHCAMWYSKLSPNKSVFTHIWKKRHSLTGS